MSNISTYQLLSLNLIASSFMPLVAAYSNSKPLSLLAASLFLITSALILFSQKLSLFSRLSPIPLFLFILICLQCVFTLSHKAGIGSGAILLCAFYIPIYYKLLSNIHTTVLLRIIQRLISLYLSLNLFFLFLEFLWQILFGPSLFADLFSQTTISVPYKLYNSAPVIHSLGLTHVVGLNSLLLGSQSANWLSFLSLLWFTPIFDSDCHSYKSKYLSLLSFIMFCLTITGTVLLCAVLLLLCYPRLPFTRLPKKLVSPLTFASVPLLIALLPFIFYRIQTDSDVAEYLLTIHSIIDAVSRLSLSQFLFGAGAIDLDLISADLGIFVISIRIGFFLSSLLILYLIFLMVRSFAYLLSSNTLHKQANSLNTTLLDINILIALSVASLIHYTPALELGGREFLSLLIASLILLLKCSSTYKLPMSSS